jgi:plasmid stabilization system protein ParE
MIAHRTVLASWFGVVGGDHRVTSIERTAYPQFRRLVSARVLHVFFTPSEDEVAWARERTETPESLLALLVDLKCFQRMARFCSREEIPQAVTDHVRHCLGLAPEVEPGYGAARTMRWHRGQVRKRQGVIRDPRRAGASRYAYELDIPGLRRWPLRRFPYLIFYMEQADHIDVWRVLHGRRDIPALMREPEA